MKTNKASKKKAKPFNFEKALRQWKKQFFAIKAVHFLKKLPKYIRWHLSSMLPSPEGEELVPYKHWNVFLLKADKGAIAQRIKSGQTYEPSLEKFIRSSVPKNGTAIDIGANLGIVSLLLSDLVGEKGKVLSFEPEQSNFELLRKNTSENKATNVHPYRMALSDRNGEAELFVDKQALGTHSMAKGSVKWVRQVQKVPMVSLDDFLKKESAGPINFIKIDTQGAEVGILRGARQTILSNKPRMSIEFWPHGLQSFGSTVDEFFELIGELGYKVVPELDSGDAAALTSNEAKQRLYEGSWPEHHSVNLGLVPFL